MVTVTETKEFIMGELKDGELVSIRELTRRLEKYNKSFNNLYGWAYIRAVVEVLESEGKVEIIKKSRLWLIKRR